MNLSIFYLLKNVKKYSKTKKLIFIAPEFIFLAMYYSCLVADCIITIHLNESTKQISKSMVCWSLCVHISVFQYFRQEFHKSVLTKLILFAVAFHFSQNSLKFLHLDSIYFKYNFLGFVHRISLMVNRMQCLHFVQKFISLEQLIRNIENKYRNEVRPNRFHF